MNHVTTYKKIKNVQSLKPNQFIQELVKIQNEFLAEGFKEDQMKLRVSEHHISIEARRPATQEEKDAEKERARRQVLEQLNTLVVKTYPLVIEQKKAAVARYSEKVMYLDQEVKLQNMKNRLAEYEQMHHGLWEKMLSLMNAPVSELHMELRKHDQFMKVGEFRI